LTGSVKFKNVTPNFESMIGRLQAAKSSMI
jgi:hypothetical protein